MLCDCGALHAGSEYHFSWCESWKSRRMGMLYRPGDFVLSKRGEQGLVVASSTETLPNGDLDLVYSLRDASGAVFTLPETEIAFLDSVRETVQDLLDA